MSRSPPPDGLWIESEEALEIIIQEEVSQAVDEAVKIAVMEKEGDLQYWKKTATENIPLRIKAEKKVRFYKKITVVVIPIAFIAGVFAGIYLRPG